MLKLFACILFTLLISNVNLYGNSQGELLRIFIDSQKNDTSVQSNSKMDYDIYLKTLENNTLTEKQRYQFYKSLINTHEIRNWNNHLKSIVLIKFVEYDKSHEEAAYQKIELSRSAFMELVNTFMKEEFSFLDEIKRQIKEDLIAKGIEVEHVELEEDQIQEAIDVVYNKLSEAIGIDYLF